MGTKIAIRRADAFDIVRLARLLQKGIEEQGEDIWYPRPSGNHIKTLGFLLTLMDQGLVIVADATIEEEGKAPVRRIVGSIGMAFARDRWSDDWMLNNEWFYVRRDWRATDVADKLLSAVEVFADTRIDPQTGQPVKIPIQLGIITGKDTSLKDALMERRGWQYAGANFVRAPHVEQQEDDSENQDSELVGTGEQDSGQRSDEIAE